MNAIDLGITGRKGQRGVTTLVVVLILLFILTLVVLASTNVALFEQKTASNETRQKLVDQAAEYAVNLSGEWLKANLTVLASTKASANGWLATGTSNHWKSCVSATVTSAHPCWAERVVSRRNQMYYYSFGSSSTAMNLPYAGIGGSLGNVGGASGATFPTTTTVNALLCRVDTTLRTPAGVAVPDCRLQPDPASEPRVAVTLIANVALDNENTQAQVKETWASFTSQVGISAVPLVASGSIEGLGGGEIVAAANGAGFGLPASIWSPCPVDIEAGTPASYPSGCSDAHPGSGLGSFTTCQLGEFLKSTSPDSDWKTICEASNPACGCPTFNQNPTDWMSGHSNSDHRENIDILDQDLNAGTLPDITFFPGGLKYDGTQMDDPNDPLDDSLFEWIFGEDVVTEGSTEVNTNCGGENCALVALRDNLGATIVGGCGSFTSASSGLFYVTGACTFPGGNSQIGTPTSPVIIVIDGDVGDVKFVGSPAIYGMLFIRSNDQSARLDGGGTPHVYGSLIVEGTVGLTGGIRIVYDNTAVTSLDAGLPANTRFTKLPGSWLDSGTSF